MKILGISKVVEIGSQKESAIDLWRIHRPLKELQKHTDWQVDFQPHVIKDFDKVAVEYKDDPDRFIKEKGAQTVKELGKYDVIFSSYFTSPHVYTLLWAAAKEHGTEFIFDIDDDLYDIDSSNPFWLTAGPEGALFLQTMARITKYLSTTNEDLAEKFKQYSEVEPRVFVNKNYIPDHYPETNPDDDSLIIGFFGGASHYDDLHQSGVLPAIQKLMHENKDIQFHSAGQPIDDYLPTKRKKIINIAHGADWPTKLFPTLKYDIAIGPLLDTKFNKHKSNIKWQEATRMGAAFISSDVGPYKSLDPSVARKVPNTREAWYINLKELVENVKMRKEQVANARKELKKWRLEENWQSYKEMFEEVHNANNRPS